MYFVLVDSMQDESAFQTENVYLRSELVLGNKIALLTYMSYVSSSEWKLFADSMVWDIIE